MRTPVALGLALGLAVASPVIAPRAQEIESREGIALRDQILELRAQVQALQAQPRAGGGQPAGGSVLGGYAGGAAAQGTAQGSAPASDISAQLLDRVQRLEEEVRTLRGRLDEANNAHTRAEADLAKQIGDLNFRLDNGAAAAGATAGAAGAAGAAATLSPRPGNLAAGDSGAAAATPIPPVPPAPPAAPRRTPELVLQEGNTALARKDYAASEAAAREVLAMPKTPRATEAQFLLAQSLAGRKDYAGAAVAYDDTYNRARTGSRAQDSLLGLANALTALNEKKAACETLDKLRGEFPSPRADLRDSIAASRKSAGCR